MLSTNTIKSGVQEKEEYYTEDESLETESRQEQAEYYSKQEMQSETQSLTQAVWYGEGAKKLGLEGNVKKEDFKDLFYGFMPGLQERIRGEKPNPEDQERLAEDFTFSAPKSVSMALHLSGDMQFFDAHMESVKEVLDEVEQRYATTRIQRNGERLVVNTDNLTIALIPHHTSRDGDMQMHTHAVIMNGTQGPDGVWRALHNDAMSLQGWLGNLYRQKLARKLQSCGYEIYATKDGFELKGLTRKNIEVFSKRSRSIVKHLEEAELEVTPHNRDRATLTTRKTKHITQTLFEFQQGWKAEAEAMGVSVPLPEKSPVEFLGRGTAKDELEGALAHLSERSVSFSRENIYQYVFNRLQSFEIDEFNSVIEQHQSLIGTNDGRFTTAEALEQEIEIVQLWMKGQGEASPLLSNPDLSGTKLHTGQAEAVYRTLISADKHQIIHGLSGVGKTKALGELVRQLQGNGIEIRGFSPTIDAAGELQKELGIHTNTVEHLVLSKPELVRNQLWIIDEAGMMSNRQMQVVSRKAETVGARLLLVGDTGQNSSIEAGSPMRSLISQGATIHHIRKIIRQENSIQKQAVELIADGNGSAALELLKQNGYVSEEANRKQRVQAVAAQYLALSSKERQQTLIVTGTKAEQLSITKVIREGQKQEGSLESSGSKTVQLVSRQFTNEQARRADNYAVGNYIRLHRDYQSTPLKKGQLYKVERIDGEVLTVSSYGGRLYQFNPSQYKDKEVFYAQEMEIAVGDRLRWTSSDKSKGQINGHTFTVGAIEGTTMNIIDKKGNTYDVSLMQPLAVDYDLVSTSYRAQGKTAKRVIVSATNDPTSSREPFYVKISRQTKELSVYTQDLEQLRKWVSKSNAQKNPLELLGKSHEQRNINGRFDISRHSGAAEPDGIPNQRYGLQVQSAPIDYSGAIQRLCGKVNRVAIEGAIGGLWEVVEGLNRVNEQLHQGITKRSNLAREIGRLSESISNADEALHQSTEQQKEQRLIGAIQQRQLSKSIEQPLLGLRDALQQAKPIKPIDQSPLVKLVETLQQTVSQTEQRIARTIRDQKLTILADAIAQWKTDQAVTNILQLQKITQGINALNADQAASKILKTQGVAEPVNQARAEDYIYAALQTFNQTVSKSMESLKVGSARLNSVLGELHLLLKDQEEIKGQLGEISKDGHNIGSYPTPKPKKVEIFWQPDITPETPRHIDSKHWREWVEDSCVHPAIAEARLETIYGNAVYDRLISEKLATMGSGQFVTQPMARLMKAYQQLGENGGWWVDAGVDPRSFPTLKPGERPQFSLYGTFKPNSPRMEEDGKIRKYENPLGLKQKLFERDLNFSAVPDQLADQIYQKYGIAPTIEEKTSGFWYVVYKHPEIPIYRTEGNKKDAAISSQGRVVISGQGVNAGYKAKDQFGDKLPQRLLHPQLELFAQPGREIRFAFDQDSKLSTILNVKQDLVREAELLKERSCNIYCLRWDHQNGKGADDLIKAHGPIAFEKADRQAVPIEQLMKQHYRTKYNLIAKRVKNELGNLSLERVDLEVYIRAIEKGDIKDGARFVGESDIARSLRQQKPEAAEHYVQAISSVADTYKRLSDRNVKDLDQLAKKAVHQRTVALALEDEQPIILENVHEKRSRFQAGL